MGASLQTSVLARHGSRDEGCPQASNEGRHEGDEGSSNEIHEGYEEGEESEHHSPRQESQSCSLQRQESEDSRRLDEGDIDQEQARKQLGVTGFCAVNGKTAQGKALYAKAKAILGK